MKNDLHLDSESIEMSDLKTNNSVLNFNKHSMTTATVTPKNAYYMRPKSSMERNPSVCRLMKRKIVGGVLVGGERSVSRERPR